MRQAHAFLYSVVYCMSYWLGSRRTIFLVRSILVLSCIALIVLRLANQSLVSGVAFIGMIVQIPMIYFTMPLARMEGINGKLLGNCIFWISFCLVGQPLAALLYFFAWQAKYGSVSKIKTP